jgi:hypothetical protein
MFNDIKYLILVVVKLIMAIIGLILVIGLIDIMVRMVIHNLLVITKHKLEHIIKGKLMEQLLMLLMVKHRSLVVKHIKLMVIGHTKLAVKQLKLIIKQAIIQLRLVIKQPVEQLKPIKLVVLINEQLIFQLDNIQLFLDIYQLEHILKIKYNIYLYISLKRLKEHTLFNIQQHSNQSLFFLLVHIKQLLILHIQELPFDMGHIQFLTLL